jgi:pyruvate/2-oxoglutarate dehydrogenase complex dihydrolipoamide dehydrogenase (E3) component
VVGAAAAAAGEAGAGSLRLETGEALDFDTLLVATGRAPRSEGLGLDAAGVDLDDHEAIVVDDHLRTTNPWVWAAGDVTARSHHTHTAGVHGSIAASNAVLGLRRSTGTAVPRVTFTSPELAAIGAGTDPAHLPPGGRIAAWDHGHVDRAVTEGRTTGFTRLALDRRGRITGATIVSPRAGETLGEVTLAIHQRLRTRDLASVTHAYPTWNDGVWNAAIADVRERLSSGPAGFGIRILGFLRRAWVRLSQARNR